MSVLSTIKNRFQREVVRHVTKAASSDGKGRVRVPKGAMGSWISAHPNVLSNSCLIAGTSGCGMLSFMDALEAQHIKQGGAVFRIKAADYATPFTCRAAPAGSTDFEDCTYNPLLDGNASQVAGRYVSALVPYVDGGNPGVDFYRTMAVDELRELVSAVRAESGVCTAEDVVQRLTNGSGAPQIGSRLKCLLNEPGVGDMLRCRTPSVTMQDVVTGRMSLQIGISPVTRYDSTDAIARLVVRDYMQGTRDVLPKHHAVCRGSLLVLIDPLAVHAYSTFAETLLTLGRSAGHAVHLAVQAVGALAEHADDAMDAADSMIIFHQGEVNSARALAARTQDATEDDLKSLEVGEFVFTHHERSTRDERTAPR